MAIFTSQSSTPYDAGAGRFCLPALIELALIVRVALIMLMVAPGAWAQDAAKTTYRGGYNGVCRLALRGPSPARYRCAVPNGRAIRVPIHASVLDVANTLRVCVLESRTIQNDDHPCGYQDAVLLWEGKPAGDIELSHSESSFGDPPETPEDVFVAVELDWSGSLPDEGNLFSLEYGSRAQALREMKIRLEGNPSSATRTPDEASIRIGAAGYVQLLSARKSPSATWFEQGEAKLVGDSRTYNLRRGVKREVPEGEYELQTNGYLAAGTSAGFLEVTVEYETGP
jgi:hypothetical protein